DLVEQFVERLIDKRPEEIYEGGILPKGTKDVWESSLDEKVLVGLVSTADNYINFTQDKQFTIHGDQLKKNWQEARYVALYLKHGVGPVNGVEAYGEIVDYQLEQGTLKLAVDHWVNLKEVIKPVNYGIANYMMTTLNMLKEAR